MEDALLLLDSEIARLVYGHLKKLKCDEVAEKFLHMSPHMKECVQLKNKNRNFLTKAHGLSLEEIFNQFVNMNKLVLNNVNSKITNSNKKFHDSIAALQFITELNKSNFEEEDNDSGFFSGGKLKVNSGKVERKVDTCINVESSPGNAEDSKSIKPHILNLYYAESIDTESDCACENYDFGDYASMKNVSRTKFKKKVKILRPRKSFPVAGKSISRSSTFGESVRNCDEPNGTQSHEIEGTDSANLKASVTNSHYLESSISSGDVSSIPVIADEHSELSIPSGNVSSIADEQSAFGGNKNISEDKIKSNSPNKSSLPNASAIICNLLTPNINEVGTTRQLRSSTVEATEASIGSIKISRSQRNRKKSSVSSHDMSSTDGKPNTPSIDTEPPVDFALIHQKLIETPQLHVRLAENINKMMNESPRKNSSSSLSEELDITVQKVADETVNDPLCQEIINELLACVPNINLLADDETENQDINMTVDVDKNQEKETPLSELNTPIGINAHDRNTSDPSFNRKYQEIQEFVRFNNDQQQSDIIIVEVPQDEQSLCSERNYIADNQNNLINTNSAATANIRSYVMCPSDITGASKIDESVINMYTEQKQEEIIQLHGLESNSFLIGQNMPLIIGNNAKIMFSDRKTRRSRYQPSNTSTRSRKYMPIAPKPDSEDNTVTSINDRTSDTPKSNNKIVKKMKR